MAHFGLTSRIFAAAVGGALAVGASLGTPAAAQSSLFSPEQRLEIEQIVRELLIARMSGEGGGGANGSVVLVDASAPQKIVEIASSYGAAELTTDSLGDPLVRGELSGVPYDVYFFGCENGADCKNLQFRTGGEYQGVSEADVARWNREKRFGKTFLDNNGNLVLEMNLNLDFGVTQENLFDTFDWWRVVVDEYVAFFKL